MRLGILAIITIFRSLVVFAGLGLVMPPDAAAAEMSTAQNAYQFSFTSIDGGLLPLEQFRGKVVLVVNTASQCGFTGQYADLQKLYETYKDRGLVVLGVPSNDFGGQEPSSEPLIKEFVTNKFHVSFPLTAKTDVVGDNRHAFYTWAAAQDKGGFFTSVPRWNFHKYLIDRNGQLLDSFASTTSPMDEAITAEIEKALGKQ